MQVIFFIYSPSYLAHISFNTLLLPYMIEVECFNGGIIGRSEGGKIDEYIHLWVLLDGL